MATLWSVNIYATAKVLLMIISETGHLHFNILLVQVCNGFSLSFFVMWIPNTEGQICIGVTPTQSIEGFIF